MPPWVGIPLGLDACGRWRPGREYLYMDRAYARAVERAGGVPVHLPIQADPAPLLERIDALVIPGGDDFSPPASRSYPEDVRFDPVPPAQLAFDRALLAAALDRGLPVLGICYGMQLLAVHLGGRLHHHVPLDCPAAGEHRLPEPDGRHGLRVVRGSLAERVLGQAPAPVNSLHHQAVADPGPALRVGATADDGLVEAVEGPGPGFVLGVQWHPEKLPDGAGGAVFRALVEACT